MVADRRAAAEHLVQRLTRDFGYCPSCVPLVLGYFQRHHTVADS